MTPQVERKRRGKQLRKSSLDLERQSPTPESHLVILSFPGGYEPTEESFASDRVFGAGDEVHPSPPLQHCSALPDPQPS
jgi:hypothetical protein